MFAYQLFNKVKNVLMFLRLVQGSPRVIRATNLTTQKPQNGKELFQLTQCNSPVRSCLLTILTYTTLQPECVLCLFLIGNGLGRVRREEGIFSSFELILVFLLPLLKATVLFWSSNPDCHFTYGGQKLGFSRHVAPPLLKPFSWLSNPYSLYFAPIAETLWWLTSCQSGWL